jgi:hypothetical protein
MCSNLSSPSTCPASPLIHAEGLHGLEQGQEMLVWHDTVMIAG